MNWPADAPVWLKTAIADVEEIAERMLLQDEPAKACGFNVCLINLKALIAIAAESEDEKRKKALHELTFPKEQTWPTS